MRAMEIAREAYRGAIPTGKVGEVGACQQAASDAVYAQLQQGAIERDVADREYAQQCGQRAHERETEGGKRLVKKYLDGQAVLTDLLDDAVIPLGEGQLVRFGDLDATTLQQADQLRFVNVAAVEDEYRDWRLRLMTKFMPVLVRHSCTVRTAKKNGWLP